MARRTGQTFCMMDVGLEFLRRSIPVRGVARETLVLRPGLGMRTGPESGRQKKSDEGVHASHPRIVNTRM